MLASQLTDVNSSLEFNAFFFFFSRNPTPIPLLQRGKCKHFNRNNFSLVSNTVLYLFYQYIKSFEEGFVKQLAIYCTCCRCYLCDRPHFGKADKLIASHSKDSIKVYCCHPRPPWTSEGTKYGFNCSKETVKDTQNQILFVIINLINNIFTSISMVYC